MSLDISPAGTAALSVASAIGADVAEPAAADVDANARFPHEAVDAMRAAGLLGALIPKRYGGMGCTYADVAALCTTFGRHCSSAGMIFAMHQIQVACLVEHCQGTPYFDDLMTEVAGRGRLIASATTEAGVGGDVRSSICAVRYDGDKISIEKNASVISYGNYVDDVLVTARRDDDAPPSDQVIVHVARPGLQLDPVGEWDTLGMRGTCSLGFLLKATGTRDQVVPVGYDTVSSVTMLPVSHITWASLWLGIAENAMSKARRFVRAAARKNPGATPPSAQHLAEAYLLLDRSRALVHSSVRQYDESRNDPQTVGSMRFAVAMNDLKVAISRDVVAIVNAALGICGIAGYRNDTPYSLGRQLRDAHSAALMVHNDRILDHNAHLLLVMKDD